MSFTGGGNARPKKNWFSICANCGKKGLKRRVTWNYKTNIQYIHDECKYCHIETNCREVQH